MLEPCAAYVNAIVINMVVDPIRKMTDLMRRSPAYFALTGEHNLANNMSTYDMSD